MKHILLLILLGATLSLSAQDRAPSPAATTEQKVGLTDISVTYSRPSMKGRTIFSDTGLAPYGQVWRTGANSATKITFSGDVEVGGKALKAGSYAILTTPTASNWTVNLYPYEGSRWTSYKEATPVASVQAPSMKMDAPIESFMITFDNLTDYTADLILGWESTIVAVGIKVP